MATRRVGDENSTAWEAAVGTAVLARWEAVAAGGAVCRAARTQSAHTTEGWLDFVGPWSCTCRRNRALFPISWRAIRGGGGMPSLGF